MVARARACASACGLFIRWLATMVQVSCFTLEVADRGPFSDLAWWIYGVIWL